MSRRDADSLSCSPSHFEKVSQQFVFSLYILIAVRLRISRRFHSLDFRLGLVGMLFAFAFREGFTAVKISLAIFH